MDIKQWTPVLIATLLAFGSVQAFADSGWNYDEDSDTVIFSFNGSPVPQSTSRSEDEAMGNTDAWHYDEDSDTIVYNNEGSRSEHARANPTTDAFEQDPYLAYLD